MYRPHSFRPARTASTPINRVERHLARLTAGLLTLAIASSVAGAQAPVRVSPQIITIDPKTHTARVQFFNTTADTLAADITTQYAISRPHIHAPSAATADSLRQDSIRTDSIANERSLGAWITDLPTHLLLAPLENRTVILHLKVPPTLDPGEYSVYILARMEKRDVGTTAPATASATPADTSAVLSTGTGGGAAGGSPTFQVGGGNSGAIQLSGATIQMSGQTMTLGGGGGGGFTITMSGDAGGATVGGASAGATADAGPGVSAAKLVYKVTGKQSH